MKTDPISTHERSLIIRQLARYGNWRARRMGAHVRLVRLQSPGGARILFSITRRHQTVSQQTPTVFDAIEQCNQIIRGRQVAAERKRA
jgi:hypothetical protein